MNKISEEPHGARSAHHDHVIREVTAAISRIPHTTKVVSAVTSICVGQSRHPPLDPRQEIGKLELIIPVGFALPRHPAATVFPLCNAS